MPVRRVISPLANRNSAVAVELPPPRLAGGKSLVECLRTRRSCRVFAAAPVALEQVSQLLWAAQGVTGLGGLRTAPSAGAVYPYRLYLIAMNVTGLRPGVYVYDPDRHVLSLRKAGELRPELERGVCDQDEVGNSALGILLSTTYTRSRLEFGEKGVRLAHIEAGHIAQNVMLEAGSLGLGVIGLGRIDEAAMRRALELRQAEEPVYLLLAGPK